MPAAKKAAKKKSSRKPVDVTTVTTDQAAVAPKPRKRRAATTFAFAIIADDTGTPGQINGPYENYDAMLEDIAMSASSKSAKVVTYREAKRGTLTMSAKIK